MRAQIGFPDNGAGSRNARSRTAFTLIEMMIAIAIVGILAALAMVKFDSYRDQAKLRQSAQKVFQILSWSRLQSEKQGNMDLVQIALPKITVYQDKNGNGIIDAPDGSPILTDSVENTVQLAVPGAGPVDAPGAINTGLADGPAGVCGPLICCDKTGNPASPTWKNAIVGVCAHPLPAMPSVLEDGAIYLGSTNSKVVEKWAVVMNRNTSSNQSLWTTTKAAPAAADWVRVR